MARRRLVSLVAGGLLALAAALVASSGAVMAVQAVTVDTVAICHAHPPDTAATGYNAITVSVESIVKSNGHDGHLADIIPSFNYLDGSTVKNYAGKHWDATGQAIWNNGCAVPGATATPVPQGPSGPDDSTCETVAFYNVPQGWKLIIEPGDILVTSGFDSIALAAGDYSYEFRNANNEDQVGGKFTIGVCGTQTVGGETATPDGTQTVGGETGTPGGATPPPTSTGNGGPMGGSTPLFALLISLAFGGLGLTAVRAQRRTIRR